MKRLLLAALGALFVSCPSIAQTTILSYDFSYPDLLGRNAAEIEKTMKLAAQFDIAFNCGDFLKPMPGATKSISYITGDTMATDGVKYMAFLFGPKDACAAITFYYSPGRASSLAKMNTAAYGAPKTDSAGIKYWDMGKGARCRMIPGKDCWGYSRIIVYIDRIPGKI